MSPVRFLSTESGSRPRSNLGLSSTVRESKYQQAKHLQLLSSVVRLHKLI